MFGRARAEPDNVSHLQRVEDWIRDAFSLSHSDLVLVSQQEVALPGYPKTTTVVLFWRDGGRYRFTLFKPPRDVARTDIPVGWLAPGLVDEGSDCC